MPSAILASPYWYLWAKSGSEEAHPAFHPLVCHMIDVSMVTRAMWQSVLPTALRTRMARTLGLPEAEAGTWVAFLAGLHDLGKATPAFAGQWPPGRESLRTRGFRFFGATKEPHGRFTAFALADLLTEVGVPDLTAGRLAVTVGGHHGLFPRAEEVVRVNANDLGRGRWAEGRRALFLAIKETCDLPEGSAPAITIDQEDWFFIILAALTSVADWIGSDTQYFPFAEVEIALDRYAQDSFGKAQNALRSLGWIGPTATPAPATFEAMFKRSPRPMQEAVIKIADALTSPLLFIIESPMGEGKTEAALYLADRAALIGDARGIYFALPTQATSNQMLSRTRDFLNHRYGGEAVNLQLLHGSALLSREFEQLRTGAARLVQPAGLWDEPGYDQAPPGVVASEWFTQHKRGLLALFGVGTVDQAMLAVLQTKHFFVRLFGLAGKTVIIDEVHAYDAYMLRILERLLEWLGALGSSVILLSATLPRQRREVLLDCFARGAEIDRPLSQHEASYPRISWVSPDNSGARSVECAPEVARTLQLKWLDLPADDRTLLERLADPLGRELKAALAGDGCAVVFCNTVKEARAVYRALRPFFPVDDAGDGRPELELFHARYLEKDRQWQEARARLRFGKEGDQVECPDGVTRPVWRPRRAVLVATQVVEQSLDLDFDLGVTFFAPVDLMLQRSGRLHRHLNRRPAEKRPALLQEPTLWLLRPTVGDDGRPHFGAGTEAVYQRHLLLRSWLGLVKPNERATIAIPADVQVLVEAVYTEAEPDADLSPALARDWAESRAKLEQRRGKSYENAEFKLVESLSETEDLLEMFNRQLEEDDPAAHPTIQAMTRDGGPSVRVICLFGVPERPSLDLAGTERINPEGRPSLDEARALLLRSVSLSECGLARELLAHGDMLPGWRKSSYLRHHRALFFDPEGVCTWRSWRIRIDPDLGVIVTRGTEEVDE